MIDDKEFMQLLEQYDIAYKKGDVIKGLVVGYDGDDVLVDINAKTSAICPKTEILLSKDDNVKNILLKGETYDFVVIYPQDEDGIF